MSEGAEKKPSVLLRALLKLLREPRFRIFAALCAVLAVAGAFILWKSGLTFADLKAAGSYLIALAGERPLWLFLAIAILPALPIPASPFIILAGYVFTPIYGTAGACALVILAMAINMSWTYWVAAKPGRSLVDRLFKFLELELPTLSRGHALRLVILFRVTPGLPFFLHNLVLGFLRVPFRIYLPVSVLTTGFFSIGFVIFGNSLSSGKGKLALLAIMLMMMAAVLASFARRKFVGKSPVTGN